MELLTQVDFADEEKNDVLTQKMDIDSDTDSDTESEDNTSNVKKLNGLCANNDGNNGSNVQKSNDKINKGNLLYLEQSSTQDRNTKFYPPEIVKKKKHQ